MGDRAMDVYLNDHLAGATLGSDLAEQIRARHEGDPLGAVMTPLAREIEEDRERGRRCQGRRAESPQTSHWVVDGDGGRVKFNGVGWAGSARSGAVATSR